MDNIIDSTAQVVAIRPTPIAQPFAFTRPATTGGTLMQASRQWMSRPADERFVSLADLHAHTTKVRENSRAKVVANRDLSVAPTDDGRGLAVIGPNGAPVTPSHWAFGQLAQRAAIDGQSAVGYLRALPAPLAADCINYGLKRRDVEELGVLLNRGADSYGLTAVTGPNYGRIWNSTITGALLDRFGDGSTFRVPGEFGKAVAVTKENTTLYASDRDMFVFLADETHRIEIANRRNGQPGSLARGFFVWNSEVGAGTLGIATFLFDYVCCNRIVWGSREYAEVRVRHTSGAPHRWLEEVAPAITAYANSSAAGVTEAIAKARAARLTHGTSADERDNEVRQFLAGRFTKSQAVAIQAAHLAEEGRPIETLWDAATGATAYARGLQYQDARVDIEREAGKILNLAA